LLSIVNNRLILGASSLALATCFLIVILMTRSDFLALIAASFFGAFGTWVYIRRSSSRVHLIQGAVFGSLIGAFGWLITGVVQISLLLLMGKPQVAFAPNSLALAGLAVIALLSGLGGMAISFLWNQANAYHRTERA